MSTSPSAALIRGDARHLPLPDASVDLIVTSPPYWNLRDYQDGDGSMAGQIGNESTPQAYIANLLECTAEWARVLKPSGSIFVNLGDKYAANGRGPDGSSSGLTTGAQQRPNLSRVSAAGVPRKSLLMLPERYRIRAVDDLGLIARAVIVWDKPNGLPESVTDRVRRSHEDWVHFTKLPRYFSAIDEIRKPVSDYTRKPGTCRSTPPGQRRRAMADTVNPRGGLPGSVWEIPTQPLRVPEELAIDHHAAFPMEWPRRIILGWSPAGGVVLDPFGGTGTTALVASTLGRRGVTIDRSADYCRVAQWRTTDPGQRARAMNVPKPKRQAAEQEALFGEAVA